MCDRLENLFFTFRTVLSTTYSEGQVLAQLMKPMKVSLYDIQCVCAEEVSCICVMWISYLIRMPSTMLLARGGHGGVALSSSRTSRQSKWWSEVVTEDIIFCISEKGGTTTTSCH